jgi:hypothetical protein
MVENTILFVGVLDNCNSTNLSAAISFMKRGFKILPVNYRTIIKTYGMHYFNNYIIEIVKSKKPNLVFFSKCNGVNPDLVKECNNYTKTWLWNMDSKPTILHCPEVVEHAKNATYSSCTCNETAKWFESLGVKKCYTIFEGVDPTLYKPMDVERTNKISFIGTKTGERDSFKEFLDSNNIENSFYGPGYTNEVFVEDFCRICSSSKAMLSLNTHNNIPDYFSDRVFRYMACKAPVFHWDSTNTLNKYFEDKKEILYFDTQEKLLHLLKSDINFGEIAENGYNRVIENYTWDNTITNILTIAELI